MGIHYFYGRWVSQLGAAVNTRQLPNLTGVEGILFDLNGLLHKVAERVYLYGRALEKMSPEFLNAERARAEARSESQALDDYARELTTQINDVVRTLKPRQYLFIAVDGVAPGAKIAQQRARRYGAAASVVDGHSTPPVNGFTSTLISPGTAFMVSVDTIIRTWISRAQRVGAIPRIVYYSPHTIAGEGEHKMFGTLRDLFNAGQVAQGRGAHVVYGMDADLLVLGLCSPVRNIYLSREDLHQNVNVDALFGVIRRDMTGNGAAPTARFDLETLRRDFAVVVTLVGNDFIPNSPGFLTMTSDQIFMAYRTLKEPLTTTDGIGVNGRAVGAINIHSFAAFFSALAAAEPMLLIDAAESELRDQKTPMRRLSPSTALLSAYDPAARSLSIPQLRTAWYAQARNIRAETALSGHTATEGELRAVLGRGVTLVERVVTDYVAAIAWVLRYYTGGGESVNWLFSYRYLLAPLAIDVAAHLRPDVLSDIQAASGLSEPTALSAVEFWEKRLDRQLSPGTVTHLGPGPGNGGPAIAPVHQLLAIVPPSRIQQVIGSERLAALIMRGGPLSYIAPNPGEYAMYTEGKAKEYLAVPILPEVDLLQIVDAVAKASDDFLNDAVSKYTQPEELEKRHGRIPVLRNLVPKRLGYASYNELGFLTGAHIPPPPAPPRPLEHFARAGRALGETETGHWGVAPDEDDEEELVLVAPATAPVVPARPTTTTRRKPVTRKTVPRKTAIVAV